MDCVVIDGLAISCIIGVHAWERACRQRLTVSLEITTNTHPAAESDDLSQTVDYVAVTDLCAKTAREGRFQLIETLAARIADGVLNLPAVDAVQVTIRKPGAVSAADAVGVRLTRP